MTGLTNADRQRLRRQHHLEQVSMQLAAVHRQKAELEQAAGDRRRARFHRRQQRAAEKKAGA